MFAVVDYGTGEKMSDGAQLLGMLDSLRLALANGDGLEASGPPFFRLVLPELSSKQARSKQALRCGCWRGWRHVAAAWR